MKTLTTVLATIGALFWWENPRFCLIFAIINIAIVILKREWTLYYKVLTGVSIVILAFCIWNLDLHVGMSIIEWVNNIRTARYTVR